MEYEERLCVFIDILGWKEATNTFSVEDLFKILQPFVEINDQHQFHKDFIDHAKKNQKSSKENWIETSINGRKCSIPTFYEQVQLSVFSDTLVLSKPAAWVGSIYNDLPFIIRSFLEKGFVIRGGISLGQLCHKDNIIFGPALIEAYEIELSRAIFPRILIDDKVVTHTGANSLYIMKDHLDNWVIDPFPIIATYGNSKDDWQLHLEQYNIKNIVGIIDREIRKLSENTQLMNKWVSQAKVCLISLEKYGDAAQDIISRLKDLIENYK